MTALIGLNERGQRLRSTITPGWGVGLVIPLMNVRIMLDLERSSSPTGIDPKRWQ